MISFGKRQKGYIDYYEKAGRKLENYSQATRRLFVREEYGLTCPHHTTADCDMGRTKLPPFLYYEHSHLIVKNRPPKMVQNSAFRHTCRSLNRRFH
jgi:hypothetical protein